MCERERECERERQGERERECVREREGERERQGERETGRERQTDRQTDRQTEVSWGVVSDIRTEDSEAQTFQMVRSEVYVCAVQSVRVGPASKAFSST